MTPFLSNKQRTTAAAAVTVISIVVIVGALGGLFWFIVKFFAAFDHVFLPLAVAGVIALVVRPYWEWLRNKVRLPKVLALFVLFASLILPIMSMLYLFGSLLASQIEQIADEVPRVLDRITAYIKERKPELKEILEKHS